MKNCHIFQSLADICAYPNENTMKRNDCNFIRSEKYVCRFSWKMYLSISFMWIFHPPMTIKCIDAKNFHNNTLLHLSIYLMSDLP